jgi:hypothetical protein
MEARVGVISIVLMDSGYSQPMNDRKAWETQNNLSCRPTYNSTTKKMENKCDRLNCAEYFEDGQFVKRCN